MMMIHKLLRLQQASSRRAAAVLAVAAQQRSLFAAAATTTTTSTTTTTTTTTQKRSGKKSPFQTRRMLSSSKGVGGGGGRNDDVIVPGTRSSYGSLGEMSPKASLLQSRTPAASWQAQSNVDVQRVTQKAIVYELVQQQTQAIEAVVAWFLEVMPPAYFDQVPERFRMDHIKAIAALRDANMDLYLNLKAQLPDGRQVLTFIRPRTEPGTLLHMVEELPWKHNSADYLPLTRILVFSSKDESMSLNMFVYGNKKGTSPGSFDEIEAGKSILEFAKNVQNGDLQDGRGLKPSNLFEEASIKDFLSRCSQNYINSGATDPRRFLQQRVLYDQVSGTEGTRVHIEEATEEEAGGHGYWVDVAVANSLPQVALENMCRLLFLHDFDVARSRLDVVSDGPNGNVTIIRMLVSPVNDVKIDKETFHILTRELKRVKWLDPSTMDLVLGKYPDLGVTRGEVITALSSVIHPILAKENPIAFSMANILETISRQRFIPHATAIADVFLARFNPISPMKTAEFDATIENIQQKIRSDVEDRIACEMLMKMIEVVQNTLKTNVYMPDRYALSLRLDPKVMVTVDGDKHKEMPFGVFFIHGRRFNAYHVRFRDIARGGMRLVTPSSAELFALESSRQFDECYGLAYAQQLKNKDIPEGGSKAVNLINTSGLVGDSGKFFVMRKSVKAFTDALLDLIVTNEETEEHIVDLYGKKEVLYLGPDEQVIPEDIDWVIKRATYRGYETPAAFMSSKPRAGINHKRYGVTSEGVNVYLDVALRRALNIDPTKDSFTVKVTGGPDGDVAGNEMKILCREYGDNAKILGVADASGCAEDPEGLNHDELLRLFDEALSINKFDPSKLSAQGVIHQVDTPEGIKARNSMHNRLVTDAFIPCGGRPNTIDITNYRNFLQADGTPSSPLIVEGANLFITSEARQALFNDAGVMIVKDSSANKGGVITSSYEICAAMLLDEETFFQHKDQIVAEVLEKLRDYAAMEAKLLFREFELYGGSLPEVSQIISNCINVATDALAAALDTLSENDREMLLPLFRFHLPRTIADLSFDHVHERVPEQYIKNAIASCLASRLVYKEGTKFFSSLPPEKLAAAALKYIEKEREVALLIESLRDSNISEDEKEQMIALLEAGGARTALGAL